MAFWEFEVIAKNPKIGKPISAAWSLGGIVSRPALNSKTSGNRFNLWALLKVTLSVRFFPIFFSGIFFGCASLIF